MNVQNVTDAIFSGIVVYLSIRLLKLSVGQGDSISENTAAEYINHRIHALSPFILILFICRFA